jgi:ferritin-like protein
VAEHVGYHEPIDELSAAVRERHRAIVSLMEELEAIDWYDQRVDATSDESLRAVLAHNRDEEREHAAMTLEWLRRNDPGGKWDQVLRTYLFTEAPITEVEAEAEETSGGSTGTPASGAAPGDLTRSPAR